MKLEALANSFLKEYIRKNPGTEIVGIHCPMDKPQAHVATHADVHNFISTLESQEDTVIRYDASETDTDIPLDVEAQAVDMPESKLELILACKRKSYFIYFAGFLRGRALWSTDSRRA